MMNNILARCIGYIVILAFAVCCGWYASNGIDTDLLNIFFNCDLAINVLRYCGLLLSLLWMLLLLLLSGRVRRSISINACHLGVCCCVVEDLRQTVMDDWRHHGFDAVICPGFGCTALNIGSAGKAAGDVACVQSILAVSRRIPVVVYIVQCSHEGRNPIFM